MAIETIYVDGITTSAEGIVTVDFHLRGEPVAAHSRTWPSYAAMISDNQSFLYDHEIAIRVALTMWLGADPTGGDPSLATEFRTEIDPTALVSIRRVLNV